MGGEDQLIEEYKRLCAEIGRNSQISQNVFVANVGVTAVLIGYGLESSAGPIFLSPFAIIIPSLFFLASQLESTTRIAAYISVFFEKHHQLNWETRWLRLRQNRLLPTMRMYAPSLSGLYGLISAVCLCLAYVYWCDKLRWFIAVAVIIAVLVFLGIRMLIRAFSLELCETYIRAWEKLESS